MIKTRDAQQRKEAPIFSGVLAYFPDAIAEVAELSRIGNEQHNPGQPLHWDRSKSGDEKDALTRHLIDAGTLDTDGVRHSTKVAWRALANLQKEIETSHAPKPTVSNGFDHIDDTTSWSEAEKWYTAADVRGDR